MYTGKILLFFIKWKFNGNNGIRIPFHLLLYSCEAFILVCMWYDDHINSKMYKLLRIESARLTSNSLPLLFLFLFDGNLCIYSTFFIGLREFFLIWIFDCKQNQLGNKLPKNEKNKFPLFNRMKREWLIFSGIVVFEWELSGKGVHTHTHTTFSSSVLCGFSKGFLFFLFTVFACRSLKSGFMLSRNIHFLTQKVCCKTKKF